MTGQNIAHYRISAKLGEGGMGAVYRAVGENGQRFLINSEMGETASAPIIIVQNWTSGVKR